MNKINLNKVLKEVFLISKEAGDILIHYQNKRSSLKILSKGAEGIATQADKKSEDYILKSLKKIYPDHLYVSEEEYFQNEFSLSLENTPYLWLIDPLDGTNNFVHGIPFYCTSISLLHFGKPVLGVIYNPNNGEYFYAQKDKGAFQLKNGKKLKLKSEKKDFIISECIFAPSMFKGDKKLFKNELVRFLKNTEGARAFRRLGSAALELCYVASSAFDAYWEKNLKPWDIGAASLICTEAGFEVRDFLGNIASPFSSSILAGHSKVLKIILKKNAQS